MTSQEMERRRKEELLQDFRWFKLVGYFSIELDSVNSKYIVQQRSLYISFCVWYILTTFIMMVWLIWFGDVKLISENQVIGGSLFFFSWGIAPLLTTFAIIRITLSLPTILEEIFNLREMKTKFHRSLATENTRYLFLGVIPTVINIVIVAAYLIYITPEFFEPEDTDPTEAFVLIIYFFLVQVCITTLLCSKFIGILYTRISAVRDHFDISYKNFRELSPLHESSPADWEGELKAVGDYIEKMQEILRLINEGFMRYVTSVNILIDFVSSIPCIMVMLKVNNISCVMYAFPVLWSTFFTQNICGKSYLMSKEYENLLFSIRRLSLLERRYPGRLPYGELHTLQELLRSSPLQAVTFGGIPLGPRLAAAVIGFILTYTVLIEDLMGLKNEYARANGTVFLNESDINNLTDVVNTTDINNLTGVVNTTDINN